SHLTRRHEAARAARLSWTAPQWGPSPFPHTPTREGLRRPCGERSWPHTILELGQAPRVCVCSGYGHVSSATVWAEGSAARCAVTAASAWRPSLLLSGSAAHYRRHPPSRGDPEDAPPSETHGRPAADRPGSCSPSNVRLSCLRLRRRTWSRWRRARSGGVSQ